MLSHGLGIAAAGSSGRGRAADAVESPVTYALLIGVSRPSALPERLWLRGPANDVELMQQTLVRRGVLLEHIHRFSDVGQGERPTAAAVARGMGRLLAAVKRADTVILHLAGHAVQVPMRSGSAPEADGLDEVFLLVDTERWDPLANTLPHALYDDDIGAWMDSIVDCGARVVAFFDTCHAASLHRRRGIAPNHRGLVKEELGVPNTPGPSAAFARRTNSSSTPALAISQRLDGRVLGHAARAHESTPEERLPRGAKTGTIHGVFSFAVAEALRAGASESRALSQWLSESYRRDGRDTPVPIVRGEGGLGLR